jgi:hypothetical protein
MGFRLVASVSVALVLAGPAAATSDFSPILKLGADNAVRGLHFKSHEFVRLVFVTDGQQIRRVRASAGGSFAASLPTRFDSCSGLLVRAAGSSGDFAVIDVPRAPCPVSGESGQGSPVSGPTTGSGGSTAADGVLPPAPGPAGIHR